MYYTQKETSDFNLEIKILDLIIEIHPFVHSEKLLEKLLSHYFLIDVKDFQIDFGSINRNLNISINSSEKKSNATKFEVSDFTKVIYTKVVINI